MELAGSRHNDENIESRLDDYVDDDDIVLVEGLPEEEEEKFIPRFLDHIARETGADPEVLKGMGEVVDGMTLRETSAVRDMVPEENVIYLDSFEIYYQHGVNEFSGIQDRQEALRAVKGEGNIDRDAAYALLNVLTYNTDVFYDVVLDQVQRNPIEELGLFIRDRYDADDAEVAEVTEPVSEHFETWDEYQEELVERELNNQAAQEREYEWVRKVDDSVNEYGEDLKILVGLGHIIDREGTFYHKLSENYSPKRTTIKHG